MDLTKNMLYFAQIYIFFQFFQVSGFSVLHTIEIKYLNEQFD